MTAHDTTAEPIDASPTRAVARFGPFCFDRGNGLLYRDGREVNAPPRVLAILDHLVDQPGRVMHKRALIKAVWKDAFVTDTSLTEAMSVLRQALGDDSQHPTYIQTVHRRGYRFVAHITFGAPPEPPFVPQAPITEPPADHDETLRPADAGHTSVAPHAGEGLGSTGEPPARIGSSSGAHDIERASAAMSATGRVAGWTGTRPFWLGMAIGFTVGALSATLVAQLVG